MRKLFTQQFVGLLGILCSLILSVTLYAYNKDQTHIEDLIKTEVVERKNADIEIKAECAQSMEDHNNNIHQALTDDIKEVAASNIRTEDKVDQILFLLAKTRE